MNMNVIGLQLAGENQDEFAGVRIGFTEITITGPPYSKQGKWAIVQKAEVYKQHVAVKCMKNPTNAELESETRENYVKQQQGFFRMVRYLSHANASRCNAGNS